MNDDQLRAFIERQEAIAQRSETAFEQAQAMDYYLRRPFGNEEEGRSQVISSDVWDVVEGMTPTVIKPFVSSADAVVFNPQGPEDEEAAKQETDYLNYVVTQQNDSFTTFVSWAKAGLLQKNGIVKYWWDKTRRVSIETYRGMSEDVLTAMLEDDKLKVIAKTEVESEPVTDPQTGQQMPGPRMFDVTIRATETDGRAAYATVPPEEFLIIGRDPDPQKASFVQHRSRVTISDLREMGYDVEDDIQDAGSGAPGMEIQAAARNQNNQFDQMSALDGSGDPSMREVWFKESYCYVDYDEDGVSELRKVCAVGSTVLANDETEEIQFAAWTPYQQLWQFDGRCPADEACEVQEVKTTLIRESLNNLYTISNNRVYAGNKVNLDDLIDNQIGGIVRVDAEIVGNQIQVVPISPIGQVVQPAIEYWDGVKENRTGFTRYQQGAADLNNQKTLGEIRIVSAAGNARIELIQRSLAEQGMKPLMLGLHGLLRRHATKAETIRLRGQWVEIDPREWKKRRDMTISVGLGTMDKSLELQAQSSIVKMQQEAAGAGVVSPENVYNSHAKFVELTGEKDAAKYFTHPDKMPPKQPPDPMQDPEYKLKVGEFMLKEKQLEIQTKQKDRELDQMDSKLGIEQDNARFDALERHQKLEMEAMTHQRDMQAPHPQELAAGDQALAAQQAEQAAQQPQEPTQ